MFDVILYTLYIWFIRHTTGMSHLKIVNASRGSIQKFENLKRKLYRCNANIYFNKQCLKKQLTPSYANIKVPNTSPAHKYTQHKLSAIRIKDEIKYLHSKKQQLNQQIYHLHTLHLIYSTHNGDDAPQNWLKLRWRSALYYGGAGRHASRCFSLRLPGTCVHYATLIRRQP